MCMTIKASSADVEPDRIVAIARAWPADKTPFYVDGRGGLRPKPIGFALHGCDLLSDEADWDAETWEMKPEALPKLADSFAWLFDQIDQGLIVEALWDGGRHGETVATSAPAFLEVVRAGAIGTKTRYVIER